MAFSPAPIRCLITAPESDGTSCIDRLSLSAPVTTDSMRYTDIYSATAEYLSHDDHEGKNSSNAKRAIYPLYPPFKGNRATLLDFPPDSNGGKGTGGYVHHTDLLDYVFVMDGVLELEVEGYDTRTVSQGDLVVQLAKTNTWRNLSETEGARLAIVSVGAWKLGSEVEWDVS